MGFFDRIGRVFSSGYRFSGRGGGGSNYALRSYYQPSTRFDWAVEVGEVRQNPIVAIAIDWILKNSNSVPIKLYKRTRFGDEVEIEGHPVLDLLNRPNPYYSGYTRLVLRQRVLSVLQRGAAEERWCRAVQWGLQSPTPHSMGCCVCAVAWPPAGRAMPATSQRARWRSRECPSSGAGA